MISKIIAGPLGFYSYVAPERVAYGATMYEEIERYLGPLRETHDEALMDMQAALAAISEPTPEERESRRFEFLSDSALLGALRIAKHPRRGLRPFFAPPRNMIALREEAEFRGLV